MTRGERLPQRSKRGRGLPHGGFKPAVRQVSGGRKAAAHARVVVFSTQAQAAAFNVYAQAVAFSAQVQAVAFCASP
ncbi:hypothetical protein CYR32_03220 [Chimaeribacter coloradensis]|uniref:Uncharacterized protein n=1 Tax=Chimaeribacter coloradensis TaxID=2060068 RepID=A0A2N5EAT2_9GAMM|nr:hypothetical protein CYR32_03220 [Chimaeribacter coloradensis]